MSLGFPIHAPETPLKGPSFRTTLVHSAPGNRAEPGTMNQYPSASRTIAVPQRAIRLFIILVALCTGIRGQLPYFSSSPDTFFLLSTSQGISFSPVLSLSIDAPPRSARSCPRRCSPGRSCARPALYRHADILPRTSPASSGDRHARGLAEPVPGTRGVSDLHPDAFPLRPACPRHPAYQQGEPLSILYGGVSAGAIFAPRFLILTRHQARI